MIVNELLDPKSIAIIGGSNDEHKPGGKILSNIIRGGYKGEIYVVNPKETLVQGQHCYPSIDELPGVNLAIIAIPAKFTLEAVEKLAYKKQTKAFIILSAGYSEFGEEGKKLENDIAAVVDDVKGTLIGPNCIGVLNGNYKGVFAGPIPKFDAMGCDFVSGSGATIVFILEVAIPRGLTFNSIYSVGNSAQTSVEDILEFWDKTFDPATSSRVKLIYIEQIHRPGKLLRHARSLIQKGCRIAAIKAGTTEEGSRAVSSHTGALAGSDVAVDALFKKAGIVRCYSRVELVYTAGVLCHKQLNGDRLAVITHAGGSGVMLTDTLSRNAMKVPHIKGAAANELLSKLFHGSSVANPIDFLATGTAEQLGMILDYVDNEFHEIDGSVVIFGTTGMFDVTGVYDVLHEKMKTCKKPIYPVLPSVVQAARAVNHFLSLGRINFTDEVSLGKALANVYNAPPPAEKPEMMPVDADKARMVLEHAGNEWLLPDEIQTLLDSAGIDRATEFVVDNLDDCLVKANETGFPLVMKVVGPLHKTDVGGVQLNIKAPESVKEHFNRMMEIPEARAVLIQPMLSGTELFVGAKREPDFGHIILCGLGGIFIEVLGDVSHGLSPLGMDEALRMIRSIKAYKIIKGARKIQGVNEEKFAEMIVKLSSLLNTVPEIAEMDLNPVLGTPVGVIAVDARIRINKQFE